MTDPKTQKQEQTHNENDKVSIDPDEKPNSQDELSIEELAKVSGGVKRTMPFGRI